jgi:hypothetical protein
MVEDDGARMVRRPRTLPRHRRLYSEPALRIERRVRLVGCQRASEAPRGGASIDIADGEIRVYTKA